MAWTLFEELMKAGCVFLAGFFLKAVWSATMSEVKRCMIIGCGKFTTEGSYSRGLCMSCYKRAKAKVEAGETTWEKLAELELCQAERNPFDDAYSKATEGQ